MAKPSLLPPDLKEALRYVYCVAESSLPWITKLDLIYADHAGAVIIEAFPTERFQIPADEDPQVRVEAFMAWVDSRIDPQNRPPIDTEGDM